MSLTNGQLIDSKEVSKPTKAGTQVIGFMPTYRILWFVARKHRVGLLAIASIVGWGFVLNVDRFIATLI